MTTAVILAAGMGSRLAPDGSSERFAKPLIELDGQTLLARAVASCRSAGAERVVVVTGYRAELVEAEVARLDRGDLRAVQNPDFRLSNGVSLLRAREHVDERFALMMSDHVFDPSILVDLFRGGTPDGTVTLAVDSKVDAVFDLDDATKVVREGDRIVRIGKDLAAYDAIDCGLFLCTRAILDALAEVLAADGDCSLSHGMQRLGADGRFRAYDIGDRWWQDVDTPAMRDEALARLGRFEASRA